MSEPKEAAAVKPFTLQSGLNVVTVSNKHYKGLVNDLLMNVGVSMLAAKPKAGKSSLARQLAVSVAEGTDFLGKTVKQGDVLYLNLEGPEGVVKAHFKTLGLTQEKGQVYLLHEHMPRHGELGLQRLRATLDTLTEVRLVVIDTIGKLLRLANSDSYDEVTLAIESLEKIAKEYKTHVLFVTHSKKRQTDDAGDSPIGSTAFRGGTDCNIFLRKAGQRRTIQTEQRWGIPIEDETFLDYDSERQAMTLGKTLLQEEEETAEDRSQRTTERIGREIGEAILNFKGLTPEARDFGPTQGDIFAAVKGKTTAKQEVLNTLVELGTLTATKHAHNTTRYQYAVTTEQEQRQKESAA